MQTEIVRKIKKDETEVDEILLNEFPTKTRDAVNAKLHNWTITKDNNRKIITITYGLASGQVIGIGANTDEQKQQ
jgi:hypothetical protein